MSQKIGESYTINYVIVTGTTKVGDGGSSLSVAGHQTESIHLNSKHEVRSWMKLFRDDPHVNLVSVVRHSDHHLESHEVDEIIRRNTSSLSSHQMGRSSTTNQSWSGPHRH